MERAELGPLRERSAPGTMVSDPLMFALELRMISEALLPIVTLPIRLRFEFTKERLEDERMRLEEMLTLELEISVGLGMITGTFDTKMPSTQTKPSIG